MFFSKSKSSSAAMSEKSAKSSVSAIVTSDGSLRCSIVRETRLTVVEESLPVSGSWSSA